MAARGPRLLICSQGLPHPQRGASSVIFYHYVERLQREGFQVLHWLLLHPQEQTAAELDEYAACMRARGPFEFVASWSRRYVNRRGLALEIDEESLAAARKQVEEFAPDQSFLIDIVPAWAARSVPAARKVMWVGDLNFHVQFYHAWYGAREKPARVLKLPSALWRGRQWKQVYRQVLHGMDSVIVSSKSSERHLQKMGLPSRYEPYPWPNSATSDGRPVTRAEKPSFFFMGNLVGLGSRSAFHFMFRRAYPLLRRLWGAEGFQILVAGRTELPSWVASELERAPEFRYLGFVEDIDSLMASCHASLAPIDVPVGNRTRILSAMAKGSLVIAHRSTAMGNPDLVHGETCYLANDPGRFVEYMRCAYDDPQRSVPLVAKARERYLEHFAPDAATQRIVEELVRPCSRGVSRRAA